jgi:hypothetical protein
MLFLKKKLMVIAFVGSNKALGPHSFKTMQAFDIKLQKIEFLS